MKEKIINTWKDLKDFINKDGDYEYNGIILKENNSTQNVVKAFNAVGGNFKHLSCKIIENFKEFDEFLKENKLIYVAYEQDEGFGIREDSLSTYFENVEEEFNVRLDILN